MNAFFNFKIPTCTDEEIEFAKKNGKTIVSESEGLVVTTHIYNCHYYIEHVKPKK